MTQEPSGITLRSHARRKERPQRTRRRPNSSVQAAGDVPGWGGCSGRRGERPQEPAERAKPLTSRSEAIDGAPSRREGGGRNPVARAERSGGAFCAPRGQRGKARRSVRSSVAEPTGARTSPGSPAQGGGSAAAPRPLRVAALTGPPTAAQTGSTSSTIRARAWLGRRGGSASAVCAMAQLWTMVAWAPGPRDPLPQSHAVVISAQAPVSVAVVIHMRWGKQCTLAGEGCGSRLGHDACWESTWRRRGKDRPA